MKIKNCRYVFSVTAIALLLILINGCKKDNENPYQVVADIDGNIYQTIKIGNQEWMVENLKTKRYRNGDSIYYMPDNQKWAQTGLGAWCYPENNSANDKIYGKFYNGYAVVDSRNIAPEGWHVPTAAELWTLNLYISEHPGVSVAVAKALADIKHWYISSTVNTPGNDMTTNNASGFSALPGGLRRPGGDFGFDSFEKDGYWWSTDEMVWNLNYNNTDVNVIYEGNKNFGYSVRCIKD
ncbi:MAG TPA: fibrobacter succinogenes major paralogous domain-containing protein [Prolixibacteraceae bacterium]|nr:fibrobacter succinogenes major paralogous domain-containing protein [Prolixibacteraceae bacterium]